MEANQFLSEFESSYIPIHGVRFPEIKISSEIKKQFKLNDTFSNFEILKELCFQGFDRLNISKKENPKKYSDRLKYELSIINELGFTDYILLIWKLINFCREKNIPYSKFGRGSGVGSLVLYSIGITGIDPIKNNLYFERFISKTRSKKIVVDGITYITGNLMDIDSDFSYYYRKQVVEFLKSEYPNQVSKILTFNTLSGRLAIKEVGKVLGLKTEEEMTHVTSLVPKLHGVIEDLDIAYKNVLEFQEWCDKNRGVYETTLKLSDLIKNKGSHPSGYMVLHDKLENTCPIELTSDKDLVSSYDMHWVNMFAVKADLLGLRCADIIEDVCKQVDLKIENIDLNDKSIYDNLQNLRFPHGLFQIETESGLKICNKVKPKNFEEVAAIVSLNRPGSMMFIDDYAKYTTENIVPEFDIESQKLKNIMAETGGVVLFQETLMRIANEVFGLSLEDAENIRRGVGKKKQEEINKFESIIIKQGEKLNIPKSAKFYWNLLNASASYSFNKSHANAYGAMTCICTYLKFNFPLQFYLSLLKMSKFEPSAHSEIAKIHKEMVNFGIKLLPPNIIKSKNDFAIEGNSIRFGLSSIKGVSEKTMEKINSFKREYANKFELFQCAKEAGLSVSVVSALIMSGCLPDYEQRRTFLTYEYQVWNSLTDKEKMTLHKVGEKFNYKVVSALKYILSLKDETGKLLFRKTREETIKKKSEKYKQIFEKNRNCESWSNYFHEKKYTGYTYYITLKELFKKEEPDLINISELKNEIKGTNCTVVGIIEEVKMGTSKNGNKYAKFLISDEVGLINTMIFSENLEKMKEINARVPKEDDVVVIQGTFQGDVIFARNISLQQNKIYTFDDKNNEELD